MRNVVEEETSPDGQWKTQLCKRADGNLQVFLQRWSDEPTEQCWVEVTTATSITDSWDVARELAQDLRERHARS